MEYEVIDKLDYANPPADFQDSGKFLFSVGFFFLLCLPPPLSKTMLRACIHVKNILNKREVFVNLNQGRVGDVRV